MRIEPGYESLAEILQEALDQAQSGKGKERHAHDEPFDKQEICNGARLCGLGAMAFQVRKKTLEAVRLIERGGAEKGEPDILGAIVYAAAMLLVAREQKPMKWVEPVEPGLGAAGFVKVEPETKPFKVWASYPPEGAVYERHKG
jgi:hypothetical protein